MRRMIGQKLFCGLLIMAMAASCADDQGELDELADQGEAMPADESNMAPAGMDSVMSDLAAEATSLVEQAKEPEPAPPPPPPEAPAPPAPANPYSSLKVVGYGTKIYGGPDANFAVVGQLPPGATVYSFSQHLGFHKISPDRPYWVRAQELASDTPVQAMPVGGAPAYMPTVPQALSVPTTASACIFSERAALDQALMQCQSHLLDELVDKCPGLRRDADLGWVRCMK